MTWSDQTQDRVPGWSTPRRVKDSLCDVESGDAMHELMLYFCDSSMCRGLYSAGLCEQCSADVFASCASVWGRPWCRTCFRATLFREGQAEEYSAARVTHGPSPIPEAVARHPLQQECDHRSSHGVGTMPRKPLFSVFLQLCLFQDRDPPRVLPDSCFCSAMNQSKPCCYETDDCGETLIQSRASVSADPLFNQAPVIIQNPL